MKVRFTVPAIVAAAALAGACVDGHPQDDEAAAAASERGGIGTSEQALVAGPISVLERRSLAVTETAIVSAFSLRAVLDQLAAQSGVPGLSGVKLFQQLWDTQNPAPGVVPGPRCDDVMTNGQPSVNTFPYPCRTGEGVQAQAPDVEIESYKAVGLFNRFDLAPANGADCGEHRVVFGRTPNGFRRSFVIFEAVLANPHPELGLEGCRPVAEMWRGLSDNNDIAARRAILKDFYFSGLPGFSPVIHIENYGVLGAGRSTTGQVRTNQFLQSPWVLRELKLNKVCGGPGCSLFFTPVTDKTNPFGELFRPDAAHPRAAEFQSTFFPKQVPSLAANDINRFSYSVPDKYNTGESISQGVTSSLYVAGFSPTGTLANNIQAKLDAIGSALTPTQIVARAQALSCAGCHQLSNGQDLGGGLIWPSSLGFVHVSEQAMENGPDGDRFLISPALTNVFLPQRKKVFDDFLNRPAPLNEYNSDRRADMVIYRPGSRTMSVLTSGSDWQDSFARTVGQNGDRPVAGADFDGDGLADMAAWRPAGGSWTVRTSSSSWQSGFTRSLGAPGDVPLTGADLDGDRKAELLVFRPSSGTFRVALSSSDWQSTAQYVFGAASDTPLTPADYDGDRKADLVIYRPANRTINVLTSGSGWQSVISRNLGQGGDKPVSGADLDGDGQADMAVWCSSTGKWSLRLSSSNWQTATTKTFGAAGDVPLPAADFDGDARADLVVFRPANGKWKVLLSSSGDQTTLTRTFGGVSEIALTR